MSTFNSRVAIVFPADSTRHEQARVEETRLAEIARALSETGLDVFGVPYADAIATAAEARLRDAAVVLVWYNPIEGGRDRTGLNRLLTEIAAAGAVVSAHPSAIDKMGTKDVLYQTRSMGWGCDTRRYDSLDAMREQLPSALAFGPRVVKQMRGQSGDGVWKVALTGSSGDRATVLARHAKRGCIAELMAFDDFIALCRSYFASGGAMIDQPYQARLPEGMIRCYVVRDRVAGFGEQLVNALYPAPEGRPESEAPLPGPRLYFPPDRPDFHPLKKVLEGTWIQQMCGLLSLAPSDLPALWDADFLRGTKSADGEDTYMLCEINVSSVYPFPPSAIEPLVRETLVRVAQHNKSCRPPI